MGDLSSIIECSDCGDTITINFDTKKEYEHFQRTGQLFEGSEAFYDIFWSRGWVLYISPSCDLCKYENSPVYWDTLLG